MSVQESIPQEQTRLGLMIGSQRWLLDLEQAGEIVSVPASITPVPLTRDWLLGLVNLRGALYTVVDLCRFAGVGRTEVSKDARLLALSGRLNFNASILVSRMLGLRNMGAMTRDDTDRVPQGFSAARVPDWVGAARVDADGQRWFELDLARLVSSSDFLLVGR
jgi:twitching motility protein PilI